MHGSLWQSTEMLKMNNVLKEVTYSFGLARVCTGANTHEYLTLDALNGNLAATRDCIC